LRVLLTSLVIKEVIALLEFAGFNRGDVDQRPTRLVQHGQVSSLLLLKVGYFEDSNSHLVLKVSRFGMGI
jgi:hypothetical protein